MSDIQVEVNEAGRGAFFVEAGGKRVAEMVFSIVKENLTVFHTEVSDSLKGQGVAGQLLKTMVEYVRRHNLKVIPLCPYVSAQFKRHPELYTDIWNQTWHG